MRFYHVTDVRNLPRILQRGLVRQRSSKRRVFLWDSLQFAVEYAVFRCTESRRPCVILRVDAPKSWMRMDNGYRLGEDWEFGHAWMTSRTTPPERILSAVFAYPDRSGGSHPTGRDSSEAALPATLPHPERADGARKHAGRLDHEVGLSRGRGANPGREGREVRGSLAQVEGHGGKKSEGRPNRTASPASTLWGDA